MTSGSVLKSHVLSGDKETIIKLNINNTAHSKESIFHMRKLLEDAISNCSITNCSQDKINEGPDKSCYMHMDTLKESYTCMHLEYRMYMQTNKQKSTCLSSMIPTDAKNAF